MIWCKGLLALYLYYFTRERDKLFCQKMLKHSATKNLLKYMRKIVLQVGNTHFANFWLQPQGNFAYLHNLFAMCVAFSCKKVKGSNLYSWHPVDFKSGFSLKTSVPPYTFIIKVYVWFVPYISYIGICFHYFCFIKYKLAFSIGCTC